MAKFIIPAYRDPEGMIEDECGVTTLSVSIPGRYITADLVEGWDFVDIKEGEVKSLSFWTMEGEFSDVFKLLKSHQLDQRNFSVGVYEAPFCSDLYIVE